MDFRDTLADDLRAIFCNPSEFAEAVELAGHEGICCIIEPLTLESSEGTDRPAVSYEGLTLSLAASIIAITTAETVPEEPWQADLRALMDDSSVPRSTSLKYDVSAPENSQTHEAAVEKVNGSGLTMRIDFSMIAPENYTKDDWAQLDQWLE